MNLAGIQFTKLTAGGNDFVCLDNTGGCFDALIQSPLLPRFVRLICRRGLAVGADGVIFADRLGDGDGIDICARFMEPDGSEASLCGNGVACFTYWVITGGLIRKTSLRILTAAGTVQGKIADRENGRVLVCVPEPREYRRGLHIVTGDRTWEADFLVTGVPHAVIFVDTVEDLDVHHWGHKIRRHEMFGQEGVNANFVSVLSEGHIAVRTFEYGVEAETLACGTGSSASAIAAALRFDWDTGIRRGERPVLINVRGGEQLKVWFVQDAAGCVKDVCIEAGVKAVYDGVLRAEVLRRWTEDGVENEAPRHSVAVRMPDPRPA